jgi:uncharacterized membrane protein
VTAASANIDTEGMVERASSRDDENPGQRAFDYDRTVALSDGVFAIALTLLVLNLTVPALTAGHHGELGARLLDRTGEFMSYALSFAVIGLLWVRHHAMFRSLEKIDTGVTVLNLTYLAFVAFLPFPTRVLGKYGDEAASVVLYALTLAIVGTIGGLLRIHARRRRLLSEAGARALAGREHWAIAPMICLVSIPIAFVSPTAAELSWLLFLVPPLRRGR